MTNLKPDRMTAAMAKAAFEERLSDFSLPTVVVSAPPAGAVPGGHDRRHAPADDAEDTKGLLSAE